MTESKENVGISKLAKVAIFVLVTLPILYFLWQAIKEGDPDRIHAKGMARATLWSFPSFPNLDASLAAVNLSSRGHDVPEELSHRYSFGVIAPLRFGYCARTRVYRGGYAYFWCSAEEEVIYGLNEEANRILMLLRNRGRMKIDFDGMEMSPHKGINTKTALKAIHKQAKKEGIERGTY